MTKTELRRWVRQQKQLYTREQLQAMSERICQQLLSHSRVAAAHTIMLYHSLPDEVNTHALIMQLLCQGKTVLLPRVVSDTDMVLHRYTAGTALAASADYGILEPNGEEYTPQMLLDAMGEDHAGAVAIVPGMAFDAKGHRLGRGKGYYDRFLSRVPSIYKIGLCYPFQMADAVEHDDYDISMDEIVC